MQEEILNKILKRLNILIHLGMVNVDWDRETDQRKIKLLDSFDLRAGEIAEIIGKPSTKISKQLYAIKQSKKGGGNE